MEELSPPPGSRGGAIAASFFSIHQDDGGVDEGGLALKPSRRSSSAKKPKLTSRSSPPLVEAEGEDGRGWVSSRGQGSSGASPLLSKDKGQTYKGFDPT